MQERKFCPVSRMLSSEGTRGEDKWKVVAAVRSLREAVGERGSSTEAHETTRGQCEAVRLRIRRMREFVRELVRQTEAPVSQAH